MFLFCKTSYNEEVASSNSHSAKTLKIAIKKNMAAREKRIAELNWITSMYLPEISSSSSSTKHSKIIIIIFGVEQEIIR